MGSYVLTVWVRQAAPCIMALAAIAVSGCTGGSASPALTSEQTGKITNDVRAFAATVASDVTRQGPAAWRTHFADISAFFMAAEGRLVFANNDDAKRGIQELTTTIAHLELQWGEPMLVDPLTPSLVMVGMPYHETRVDTGGHQVDESGYFTGLAERGSAGWKFRDAHWSVVGAPKPVP